MNQSPKFTKEKNRLESAIKVQETEIGELEAKLAAARTTRRSLKDELRVLLSKEKEMGKNAEKEASGILTHVEYSSQHNSEMLQMMTDRDHFLDGLLEKYQISPEGIYSIVFYKMLGYLTEECETVRYRHRLFISRPAVEKISAKIFALTETQLLYLYGYGKIFWSKPNKKNKGIFFDFLLQPQVNEILSEQKKNEVLNWLKANGYPTDK